MEHQIDTRRLKIEVDENYDFLQRNLSNLIPRQTGRYALLKSREIVSFYDRPGDAYRDGLRRFPDGIFSIQEVTDEALDLGFFSYAGT